MLLLGISTKVVGRLVGRRFSGRVGSGIYVVKRISFCKACCIVSRKRPSSLQYLVELDHT